jgi:hypothetical protein
MKDPFEDPPGTAYASAEERDRAVAHWEGVVRPDIAPAHMQPHTITDADRQAAEEHLRALYAARSEPIVVGDALARLIAAHIARRAQEAAEEDRSEFR